MSIEQEIVLDISLTGRSPQPAEEDGEMSEPETYWIKGTMWFTRENCERQCQVIHARPGTKEAPERDAPKEDLAFLGVSRKEDGSFTLEMRKYRASHPCVNQSHTLKAVRMIGARRAFDKAAQLLKQEVNA